MKLTGLLLILIASLLATAAGGNARSGPTQRAAATQEHSASVTSGNVLNLADFGALGNGVTDDGPALQNALDALAESGGGTLFVPAGRYPIITPVNKNFTGLATSITIIGVESSTEVPPANSDGLQLSRGLDLVSEFSPRTGELGIALNLSGLQNLFIKHLTFIGTPDVYTDASVTLALRDIEKATIQHCEFYGLSSLVGGGAIVLSVRSNLFLEQSVFLGCTGDSGVGTPVVQNLEWKGLNINNAVFIDYGQRPELYGKLGISAPSAWVNLGNAAALDSESPRRQAVIKDVFLDEGAFNGITSLPFDGLPLSAPIDLVYISGLHMNVSNLNASGHYLAGVQQLLIEDSHYGWSHSASAAINLVSVGTAVLDRVECVASADRILADAATGELTVIDSIYNNLDSLAQTTRVIETNSAEEDPLQYVRQQFNTILGREPDAAAHIFWSNRQLECGEDSTCIADQRAALNAYLNTLPAPDFSTSGRITDEDGGGLPGVVVTLSGSQSVATQTDAEGRYHFSNLPTSGVYAVTPSRVNYTFDQPTQIITTPNGEQTIDFGAILNRHDITVRILDPNGNPLPEVSLLLIGSQKQTVITDVAGETTFASLPATGDYTITPQKPNYTFSPTSIAVNSLSADESVTFVGTPPKQLEFSEASYSVSEGTRTISVTVMRTGDTSGLAEVIYSASDGSADQRSDVIPIMGRLSFEPNESNKSFLIFVTDDAHVEGEESLMLQLNVVAGGILGACSNAPLVIVDNDSGTTAPNPIDGAEFFVRQQYRDFLNRLPDDEGLAFWSNQIISCGDDAACIADRRMNVSAAFFLSIEFQQTGFLVYRLYRASFGQPPEHLEEFLLDTRTIGDGVVVNAPGWEELLNTNRTRLTEDFVERPRFTETYPLTLTPAEFVNQLNLRIGSVLSQNDLAAPIGEFEGAATSESIPARARALHRIAENETFSQSELNRAFVLMQYFGYLQRNPSDAPDTNLDGYHFWLQKLDGFTGDFRRAEMVQSFLVSSEYRARFGNP